MARPRKQEAEAVAPVPTKILPKGPQRAHVLLHGLKPLLMSSPREVFEPKTRSRKTSEEYIDAEEAEKRAYRGKDGNLVVPARCIIAALVKASKLYRVRQRGISLADMIKGSVYIEPDDAPLVDAKGKPIRDYVIDKQLVVVQRNRIVRCRPRIDEWFLDFTVAWNPKIYGLTLPDIEKVVKDAGYIGLLDYRPRFGIFELKSIKLAR